MAKSKFKRGQRFCAFCGGTRMSREHIWPQWAGAYFQHKPPSSKNESHTKMLVQGSILRPTDVSNFVHRQGAPKTIKVKRVCKTCNSGWMGDYEERVRPILEPMMKLERVELLPSVQLLLAEYFTMKTMVSDLDIEETSAYSQEERTAFYRDRTMPSGLTIGIFRFVPEPHPIVTMYNKETAQVEANGKSVGRVANFTLRFGPLFIQVIFIRWAQGETKENPVFCIRIFPPHDESVRWPTFGTITFPEAFDLQHILEFHRPPSLRIKP